jgi:hypothetical protein
MIVFIPNFSGTIVYCPYYELLEVGLARLTLKFAAVKLLYLKCFSFDGAPYILEHTVDRDIVECSRIRGSVLLTYGSIIQIRILLFSSVADKMPTKNNFFSLGFFSHFFLKAHSRQYLKINSP